MTDEPSLDALLARAKVWANGLTEAEVEAHFAMQRANYIAAEMSWERVAESPSETQARQSTDPYCLHGDKLRAERRLPEEDGFIEAPGHALSRAMRQK